MALGTLYRYFNSKDHLFACALKSWSQRFGDHLDLNAGRVATEDRVKAIYRRAARAFERQPRVYDVVMQVQSSKDPHAAQVWREFARQQSDAFGLALETLTAVRREAGRRDRGDERGARREPAQLAARAAAAELGLRGHRPGRRAHLRPLTTRSPADAGAPGDSGEGGRPAILSTGR